MKKYIYVQMMGYLNKIKWVWLMCEINLYRLNYEFILVINNYYQDFAV